MNERLTGRFINRNMHKEKLLAKFSYPTSFLFTIIYCVETGSDLLVLCSLTDP